MNTNIILFALVLFPFSVSCNGDPNKNEVILGKKYIYPVASINNGATLLYIHQHNPTNIELYSLDTHTNNAEQILWSIFTPAGLVLLPNNAGFSFIDNGRLRVKLFERRSPKSIDFDEPIYNINSVHWIDERSCYCSAQYNDNCALFELHDDGTMQCLVAEQGKDCMYPQKIDNHLFYIERDANHYYKIMRCLYNSPQPSELLIDCDNTPIIFLTMILEHEGFILGHPKVIDSDQPTISFSYHHITKNNNDSWSKNILFSFAIPTNLLLEGEQQLYESILPLLPRVIENKIYFIDCTNNNENQLEPYFYDLSTQTIQRINVPAKKGHCFVPMRCGQRFYCGGTSLAFF